MIAGAFSIQPLEGSRFGRFKLWVLNGCECGEVDLVPQPKLLKLIELSDAIAILSTPKAWVGVHHPCRRRAYDAGAEGWAYSATRLSF